jgi:hypothetical protein
MNAHTELQRAFIRGPEDYCVMATFTAGLHTA